MAFAQRTFRESLHDIEDCLAALRSIIPSGLPQPCLSQYIGRCQRSARLAYLRGSSGAPDQKGKTALCWPGNGCRTTTKRLCTRFDNDRTLFEPLSVGPLSLRQSRDQITYSTRPAWTDSFLYCNHRWALPRHQRPGCADRRAGSLLHHGSWLLDFSRLDTLHQAGAYFVIRARKDLRFVRYSRKAFPDKLRMVRFYDSVQDRRFCFLI
jgi:hypothetical protein